MVTLEYLFTIIYVLILKYTMNLKNFFYEIFYITHD